MFLHRRLGLNFPDNRLAYYTSIIESVFLDQIALDAPDNCLAHYANIRKSAILYQFGLNFQIIA